MVMANNLEDRIRGENKPGFKSEGERKIAKFLDKNSIQFQYEPAVMISKEYLKPRIWYPDFYLLEFKSYIEYYGLAGDKNYDRGIKHKQSVYSKTGMDVVSVYPWMFSEDWQGYIMRELERNTIQRYRNLMSKPYWAKQNKTSYTKNFGPRSYFRKRPY